MVAARAVQDDVGLATAIDDEDEMEVRRRLDQLARRIDAQRIVLVVTGFGTFETGTPTAIAAASGELQDENGRDIGRDHGLDDVRGGLRARAAAAARGRRSRVDRDGAVLATTLPALENVRLPPTGPGGRHRRRRRLPRCRGSPPRARRPDDDREPVRCDRAAQRRGRWSWSSASRSASSCSRSSSRVIVSRTLSSEVQRLLHAAQRLGRGDFSVTVPAEGNDEFAALGKEFNSMARQLEARLDDLATRARPPAGGDPPRRRVVRARARPRRRAGDRRADGGRRRRRRLRPRHDAPAGRRADGGGRPDRRPAGAPPGPARRRGGGDGRRHGRGDQHRRHERARRAALRHRGRRPRARDRVRRPRRPPASRRRSASCSPT